MIVTLTTGQSVEVGFGPNDTLTVNANFPLDNKHHITFENLLDRDVTLVAQQGSTAWRVGSDMPIPAGQSGNNPFPSYNPGTYVWKMSDPNGAALKLTVLAS